MNGYRIVEAHMGRLIGHIMSSPGPDTNGHQTATCTSAHEPPSPECRCGVHYVTDPAILVRHIASDDLWQRRAVILEGHPTGGTLPDAVVPQWAEHGVTAASWRAAGFQATTAYALPENTGAAAAARHHGLPLAPLETLEKTT